MTQAEDNKPTKRNSVWGNHTVPAEFVIYAPDIDDAHEYLDDLLSQLHTTSLLGFRVGKRGSKPGAVTPVDREEFEKWAASRGYDLRRAVVRYTSTRTSRVWDAWCSARGIAEPQ